MRQIHTTILINASAETVWSIMTDFSRYPEWNPLIRFAEGELKLGSQIKIQIAPPGSRASSFRPQILIYNPPLELKWKGHFLLSGLFKGEHHFQIQPISSDRVKLIHREEFSGLLVPLVWKKMGSKIKAGFEVMNQALKERAENEIRRAIPQKPYYHCYLSGVTVDNLKNFGMKLLQESLESIEEFSPNNFLIGSSKGCFNVYGCFGESTPFSFNVSLTVFRSPLSDAEEEWRTVEFARTLSHRLKATAYCNVPEEIRKDQDDFYQICFSWKEGRLKTDLVELDDVDSEAVKELSRREIDLEKYYRFPERFDPFGNKQEM